MWQRPAVRVMTMGRRRPSRGVVRLLCFVLTRVGGGSESASSCPAMGWMAQTRGPDAAGDDWMALAEGEIGASLARDGVGRGYEEALSSVLWRKRESVLVLDGRVIVDRSFLDHSKHPAHVVQVASANEIERLPNAAYVFSGGTRGVKRSGCKARFPLAVITKMNGYGQCGVLVPNPYFGPNVTLWDRDMRASLAAAAARPLEARDPRALWRGNISLRSCDNDSGNRARLAAAALSVARAGAGDGRRDVASTWVFSRKATPAREAHVWLRPGR